MEQAKPRKERKISWFCKLCRGYGIVNRTAHLIQIHNANKDQHAKHLRGLHECIFVVNSE